MLPLSERLLYGVWVPREGFLKVVGDAVFADHRPEVAESAANFVPGARVVIVDEGVLVQMERRFLEEELGRMIATARGEMSQHERRPSVRLGRLVKHLRKRVRTWAT